MDLAIITMEIELTQGGFPFKKGRSYRVHPARARNLINGGSATAGAPEGAEITTAPAEDGAIYRAEEIPAEVVAPETAPARETKPAEEPKAEEPKAPEVAPTAPPLPAPAPEPKAEEKEGITGADALTGKPTRKGTAKAK